MYAEYANLHAHSRWVGLHPQNHRILIFTYLKGILEARVVDILNTVIVEIVAES